MKDNTNMKIGIITFHFVPNQGAVLQCYALQRYLELQGHDAYVINYRPRYHTVRYKAIKNPFLYGRWNWKRNSNRNLIKRSVLTGKSILRCLYLNIRGEDKRVERVFDSFIESKLNLTKEYTSLNQLKRDPPMMDAYISGSDQLWNPELLDQDFDGAYFLEFGEEKIPRIAYAVSMGKEQNEKHRKELKKHCENLTAVSLREYSEASVCATGRDVHICVDPTLLLDAEEYDRIAKEHSETEPYIFVYGFETTEGMIQAVAAAQKKYGCKIINGSPHRVKPNCECQNVREYAPDEFLSYIKQACCVVTNSYHATVFSIIYRKDFITVAHSTRGLRMNEMMGKLGLESRLWGNKDFDLMAEIPWESVIEKLNFHRKQSIEYLRMALNGVQGEDIPHYEGELQAYSQTGMQDDYDRTSLKVYSGFYAADALLKKSASGGAAAVLTENVLSMGGVAFGVVYADDFKSAHYACAVTPSQAEKFKGSKYIAAEPFLYEEGRRKSVYAAAAEQLQAGKTVLFTGTGCCVAALKRYLDKQGVSDERLITVDLICHGPTLPAVQKQVVEQLETRYKGKITDFSVRYKKTGWRPPYMHAVFDNGKVYDKPFYETEFGYAFKILSQDMCFECRNKGDHHAADITVGDYWGVCKEEQGYNPNGVSVMVCRSAKGQALIDSIDKKVFPVREVSGEAAGSHNPMFYKSREKAVDFDEFKFSFESRGLHYAVTHSKGYRRFCVRRIKGIIKRRIPKWIKEKAGIEER